MISLHSLSKHAKGKSLLKMGLDLGPDTENVDEHYYEPGQNIFIVLLTFFD